MGKKNEFNTVVSIETTTKTIRFSSMVGKDNKTLKVDTKQYKTRPFDEEFFAFFSKNLQEFAGKNPVEQSNKITIVVPDYLILSDLFSVPTMKKKNMDNALKMIIQNTYMNHEELNIKHMIFEKNQQYITYYTTLMRKEIIAKFNEACAVNKMVAHHITFASNATINAINMTNAKSTKANYALLDIKDVFSKLIFVSRGRTVGAQELSFGKSTVNSPKLIPEDLLFDYSVADLAVLNAKEKAKAKQLTAMANDEEVSERPLEDMEEGQNAESAFSSATASSTAQAPKVLGPKVARKLPKFMQRPLPTTPEETLYENFRHFVKWVLIMLEANSRTTNVKFEKVFVNLPIDYRDLIERVNEEQEENKVKFVLLENKDFTDDMLNNLELYGGYFAKQFNTINNF